MGFVLIRFRDKLVGRGYLWNWAAAMTPPDIKTIKADADDRARKAVQEFLFDSEFRMRKVFLTARQTYHSNEPTEADLREDVARHISADVADLVVTHLASTIDDVDERKAFEEWHYERFQEELIWVPERNLYEEFGHHQAWIGWQASSRRYRSILKGDEA